MSGIGICACCKARRMGAVDEKLALDSIMMTSPPPPPDSAEAKNMPSVGLTDSQTLRAEEQSCIHACMQHAFTEPCFRIGSNEVQWHGEPCNR